ncbi:hypothetical protein F511_46392 [Dorcoceras hygrometricum]|uniref:Uncharacterized protein n=1 Tax=Dorcoceras hygrometricum TaxID=472368 RepID=A0A2Z7A0M6_9LAMI|nr:hypothetical protein F511_46392 [Dorcoceras hygrometricum]
MSRVLPVQLFEMKKYVSSILCLLKTTVAFHWTSMPSHSTELNLVVPPLFKRYQLLRADIGRGFLRRTLLYRIKKFLRSQYKIEVAEPVLVVQTGEPVAIAASGFFIETIL